MTLAAPTTAHGGVANDSPGSWSLVAILLRKVTIHWVSWCSKGKRLPSLTCVKRWRSKASERYLA
jgi:hypothetical protein